jgi:hypothetical protein
MSGSGGLQLPTGNALRNVKRWGLRSAGRRSLGFALSGALVLVACGGAGGPTANDQRGSGTPKVSPPASPSPSPTATLIGSQVVSLDEVASIEQVVRDYFAAFGDADFDRLLELSAGELRSLAMWQQTLNSAFQEAGVLKPVGGTLESLEIVSVSGDEATVNVQGTVNETFFDERKGESQVLVTDITGPVTLTRSSPWLVADYSRNGRSVRQSLSSKARGKEARQGLAVTVKGVDLRPSGTVVIVGVGNTTGLKGGGDPPVIVGSSGKRFKTAFSDNVVYVEVPARSKVTTGFFLPKGLPGTTKTFRFVMKFFLGCDPVCKATATIDFRVKLAG